MSLANYLLQKKKLCLQISVVPVAESTLLVTQPGHPHYYQPPAQQIQSKITYGVTSEMFCTSI